MLYILSFIPRKNLCKNAEHPVICAEHPVICVVDVKILKKYKTSCHLTKKCEISEKNALHPVIWLRYVKVLKNAKHHEFYFVIFVLGAL